ncbi:hypothetical protein ACFQDE_15455 [Deinococcus caeni]|uniref:hypothetical protein n=1 Tax=Deinococcus caeni TaxID=569127 RepID=UPI003616B3FB
MIRRSALPAVLLPTACLLLGTASAATPFTTGAPAANAPYRNAALPVDARVNDLLLHMTLDEKIGQMTQAERAAVRDLNDMAVFGIGSVLSGGGAPRPTTPPGLGGDGGRLPGGGPAQPAGHSHAVRHGRRPRAQQRAGRHALPA